MTFLLLGHEFETGQIIFSNNINKDRLVGLLHGAEENGERSQRKLKALHSRFSNHIYLPSIVCASLNFWPLVRFNRLQMKTVSGKIVSTKAVNLSKAANILSKFVTSDNGASQSVSAYLRRASVAFNELVYFKKHNKLKKKANEDASTISDISQRNLEEDDVRVPKNDNVEDKSEDKKKKKKKKKKRKNVEVDGGEIGNLEGPERKKRRRTEADE
ncbi:unnamed protein product [Lactuca saligna]|uniref:Uncharacterized protein n=1 Tax=Lactuca saligna TaxID=75948 RepID=A0AA35VIL6_LACSI|nr:unnamed protein product [Lactuca saligna]